jgi:nucleotide-binding universal stress UspA family protein
MRNWPVLVIRAPYTGLQRILLVTDGSTHSEHAMDYLARFSIPADAAVRVAHVLPPFPWSRYLHIAKCWRMSQI